MKDVTNRFKTGAALAAFTVVGAVALFAANGCSGDKDGMSTAGASESKARVTVVVTPAAPRTFEERLSVQGNLEAVNTATVAARIPGTVEHLFVDEGDPVVAGETKLFEIDAENVRSAAQVARQDLAVARCGLREKEANRERVAADFEKAELDLHRFERLHAQGAVPIDILEQQQSRHKQTKALLKHADSLVDLGVEQLRQAEAALAIAEKDLRDTVVYAPITGCVSARMKEMGENADVGKPVLRIEDPTVIEVSAFLPAQYYPRVVLGQTRVRIRVYGIDVGELPVTYKSPTVQPELRTFEIKCLLSGPRDGVVPGAIAELEVLLASREGLGVPTEAIQQRIGRSVVFVVDGDTARMVDVTPGLQNDGWTEVAAEGLAAGAAVVTMGQYQLNDGASVTVQKEHA